MPNDVFHITNGAIKPDTMKITRNTMRADGITVGEAMDRDAAFLRSVGIDAEDGRKTHDEREEEFIDLFEKKVLKAMDKVSGGRGWEDKDLQHFLTAVREQAARVFDRKWRKEVGL